LRRGEFFFPESRKVFGINTHPFPARKCCGGGFFTSLLPHKVIPCGEGRGRKSRSDREKNIEFSLPSSQSPPTSWEGRLWVVPLTSGRNWGSTPANGRVDWMCGPFYQVGKEYLRTDVGLSHAISLL